MGAAIKMTATGGKKSRLLTDIDVEHQNPTIYLKRSDPAAID